ncbi:hypothetical protein [Hydrogenovibrio kuenenii]|uniref:hypothetical protein n=1 Tax=Hydrogenovibrio kuenenii TaxID=63658 RepID=UPI0012FE9F07|nr:hypothetical protein [Hydrogenovibrio kuenenii]
MIDWIEREDGHEEKWHFKMEKKQAESKEQDQSISLLARDEKMIQILAEKNLQEKIVFILNETGLDNYVIHSEESIADIQMQDGEYQNRLVFMVVVKASIYPQLQANLNQHLSKDEQKKTSCSEALFQISLDGEA